MNRYGSRLWCRRLQTWVPWVQCSCENWVCLKFPWTRNYYCRMSCKTCTELGELILVAMVSMWADLIGNRALTGLQCHLCMTLKLLWYFLDHRDQRTSVKSAELMWIINREAYCTINHLIVFVCFLNSNCLTRFLHLYSVKSKSGKLIATSNWSEYLCHILYTYVIPNPNP